MAIDPTRDPHAHIVTKPLPSQLKAEKGSAQSAKKAAEQKPDDPFLRAENEDDDGYDPYSDRPPMPEPMFQEDPWA